MNSALDEQALQKLMGGLLTPTCNMLPPAIPGYEEIDPCPYGKPGKQPDIERGSELVKEAGAEGAAVKVWGPKQDPGPQLMSYYADALERIGLDPDVQLLDFAVFAQVLGNEKTRAQTGFMNWTGDFPHPSTYMRQFTSSAITPTGNVNLGNVRDPTLDARFAELSNAEDVKRVEDGWADLDRYVIDKAYIAPWGYARRATFMSERMDFENCNVVHPVFGHDYSSFCLK